MTNLRPRLRLPALVFTALTALAPVYAAGCGSKAVVAAAPYNAAELEIQVKQIKYSGGKLQLQLIFVNRTTSPMRVDRNQIKLGANGQLMTRFTGTFGGMTSAVHTISPAMSHAVHVDYMIGDDYSGPAVLALSQGGIIVNDAPLPVPDFVINISSAE